MQHKRIALAHDHLFQIGGAERVLAELARLYPEAPVYSLIFKKKNIDFLEPSRVITSVLQSVPGGISYFKWYLATMPTLWERFDFSAFNIVISSSSAFVKGLRTPPGSQHVSYCHSPTRYLWSDREEYVESLSLSRPGKIALQRLLARLRDWDFEAAQRVNFFIANSQFIARRIKRYYKRDSVVIYPPVHVSDFAVSNERQPYFVIVSRLRPYKRVDLAIEAFNNLKLPLLIIGGGEEMRRLRSRAKRNIRFLGEVSDKTRNYYLARCRAFIHPQEEDFGISAVEAMAAGRPVIAYDAGGARETVIPGVTGSFFAEQSWESLAYAILTYKDGDFESTKIRQHAQNFDASVFRSRFSSFIDNLKTRS